MHGRVVWPQRWQRHEATGRRRVQEMAGALRDEQRGEGPHTVDHTHQLDVDQPSPGIGPLLPYRGLLAHHAGVVAHQIHPTEALHRRVGNRVQVGVETDVRAHARHSPRPAGERVDGDRDRVLTDVGDHHVDAALDELIGKSEADAAGSAGHHGGLPRLDLHAASPFYPALAGTSVYWGV